MVFTDCMINHPSIWAEKSLNKDDFNPLYWDGIKPIYNWVCKDPILFNKPILNVKGKLNFWDYKTENGIIPTQLIDHVLDENSML